MRRLGVCGMYMTQWLGALFGPEPRWLLIAASGACLQMEVPR